MVNAFNLGRASVGEVAKALVAASGGIFEARTFIAVDTKRGAYGIADTLQEAISNVKREGCVHTSRRIPLCVVAVDCAREDVTIEGGAVLTYGFPEHAHVIKFEAVL